MNPDLPYSVEYAKSSRASCQNCKKNIEKDSLRLAVIVQSPVHDGKVPKWYHPPCFFMKQRPKTTADIANFDNIRWEDQKELQRRIEEASTLPLPASKKGRKRSGGGTAAAGLLHDFLVQYAKSNKSTCKACEEKIVQGEIRVSKKDFESEHGRRYGGIDRWHHLECFVKVRESLQFYESGDAIPGKDELSKDDQKKLKSVLPKIKVDDVPPVKKIKDEPEDAEEEKEMKKQNDELFAIKDKLSSIKKPDLITMLEENEQQIPEGVSAIIDRLSDAICFGALKPCPKCNGQLVYNSGTGYKCTGDLTEWTKCENVMQDPKRKKFVIPSDIKEAYPDLKSLKYKVRKRLIKIAVPSTSSAVKKEDEVDSGPKVEAKPKPLKHMQFFIIGNIGKDRNTLKKEILHLGGEITSKLHENVAAIISTQHEVDKMSKKMEEAKSFNIQVITADFIEEAKKYTKPAISLIEKKTISSWGGDLSNKINVLTEKSNVSKSKGKSTFEKSGSGKMKLQLKKGETVDPDSGLQDCAHVYQEGKNKYNVTLILSDIQTKKNSYYKLQILKHDKKGEYWLFRSWGRIGTSIGGSKVQKLSLEECITQFEGLYEEKSGNCWNQRDNFVKVPGKMYPVDIDYGDEVSTKLDSHIKSELELPIQDLMKLIFDEANMKKVMVEFEIDVEKMPLGKLSKTQIQKAYSVLTDLQEVLKKKDVNSVQLVDASNRFYNLIPHNFGISEPKVLNTMEEIHAKCEMLDALLEMEIAYSLLHTKADATKNPLDTYYKQLNTEIKILDKESEEYNVIKKYVQNTHAATHTLYELEIQDVFVIKRQGEDNRYKPFKKLHNRKLLWHGSRTTNFAGILSQGLRIAPPEAPVTGYMFGKGIYFADMVSKSANYCCTHSGSPTGLLLLCEVALGNMHERYRADYIEKLPSGKHSTWGRGRTQPDPETVYKMKDGVEVPYGVPVSAKLPKKSDLLYNEYIVYDVAQVKAQYLLKMNFKYKE